ncbi:MAG: hypothetical protein AAFP90_00305, partial [Planctomycetota bacterium]
MSATIMHSAISTHSAMIAYDPMNGPAIGNRQEPRLGRKHFAMGVSPWTFPPSDQHSHAGNRNRGTAVCWQID